MLSYDPITGIFTRRKSTKGAKAGSVAGSIRKADGYVMISLDRQSFLGHILAWFYVHGSWPSRELDHKDRVRSHNTIHNLRLSDRTSNAFNRGVVRSSSGFKGVSAYKGKFVACIRVRGKKTVLGTFADAKDAAREYDRAAITLIGLVATTNKSLGLIQ